MVSAKIIDVQFSATADYTIDTTPHHKHICVVLLDTFFLEQLASFKMLSFNTKLDRCDKAVPDGGEALRLLFVKPKAIIGGHCQKKNALTSSATEAAPNGTE